MSNISQRNNYYFQQTMLSEVKNFDIISFNLFDTLLLRDVLFPRDIWRLLEIEVKSRFLINDFCGIRENIENEIRNRGGTETVTIGEIYDELRRRYVNWPVDDIKNLELTIEKENTRVNPLIKKIFDFAREQGKVIYVIADTCLPRQHVQELMERYGLGAYTELFLSSEQHISKHTGEMYRWILEEKQCDPRRWLHIGNDGRADLECPRLCHITAAAYRCPRDCFFMDRVQTHTQEEEKAGKALPQELLDESLAYSQEIGRKNNLEYTVVVPPAEETVIQVDNVSMMFNMCSERVDSIKEYVIRMLKRQLKFKEFWALRDVSFSVRRGERVGLIGLNGSGKSTMLKMVSGVMKPTEGKIMVQGSIAPLIELGAGFDLELSAKENVFLNGAILGYDRHDMKERYEQIIDFAELYDFQDVAIKNFSSGMIARLGFSIATCHVPDILIIDEILSVGDFAFQQKCHKKMRELTNRGATVLFVSHSAGDIINMCDRAIWLDHGRLIEEGQAQYIVEKYMNQ